MPLQIPFAETRRLFGPVNRPHFKTNVQHRAILRKALELFSVDELAESLQTQTPTNLRVAMGRATLSDLGKIQNSVVENGVVKIRGTAAPDREAREALLAYRDAYDTYFKTNGNGYTVANEYAKHVLQAAEQTWHDWVVAYLAARGTPSRPAWALQPLPGFDRVRTIAPAIPPRASAPQPAANQTPVRRRNDWVPPTPPLTSPIRPPTTQSQGASRPARLPEKRKFSEIIEISDSEEESRPVKRQVKSAEIIDISDSEDEKVPPKKYVDLGVVDLTT